MSECGLFWVDEGGWWCMGHYFGWVGVSGVGWGIILGGRGWVGKLFGWVIVWGMVGGE